MTTLVNRGKQLVKPTLRSRLLIGGIEDKDQEGFAFLLPY
jgi:hypothetical protein